MKKWIALTLLVPFTGCGRPTAENLATRANADAFIGRWRSTTPSLEFVRLEVSSSTDARSLVSAHLTLSGAAFDVAGQIDGDSLVAPMTITGASQVAGTVAIRALDNGTLSAQLRPVGAVPQTLTFTRE